MQINGQPQLPPHDQVILQLDEEEMKVTHEIRENLQKQYMDLGIAVAQVLDLYPIVKQGEEALNQMTNARINRSGMAKTLIAVLGRDIDKGTITVAVKPKEKKEDATKPLHDKPSDDSGKNAGAEVHTESTVGAKQSQ